MKSFRSVHHVVFVFSIAFVSIALVSFALQNKVKKEKYFILERLLNCDMELTNTTMDFSQFSATILKNIFYFNGLIYVKEEFEPTVRIEIFMIRCSIYTTTACEHFNNFTLADFCTSIQDNITTGIDFIKDFDPIVECPIKVGIYDVSKAKIGLESVMGFPLEGFRWIWKAYFYHFEVVDADYDVFEKTLKGCVQAQFRVYVSSVRHH